MVTVRLLAPDRRPVAADRQSAAQRLQLRAGLRVDFGPRLREIPIGLIFQLEDGGPDYRVRALSVKGGRVYANVEQLQGPTAGQFTVNMKLREHPDYPGEYVAILPGV